MEREPDVQIRELCPDCAGAGTHKVETGAGHVTWSKKVTCSTCDGTGHRARWIALSEFRALLAARTGSGT